MRTIIRPALVLLALLTLLTGFVYPALVFGIGQVLFHENAQGSPTLLGKAFTDAKHFWSRPSATPDHPYNEGASSGSNLGPTNPALAQLITARTATLGAGAPIDLLTASGSGLDPHISPEAAYFQVERVARARELPIEQVRALVGAHIEGRTFGVLGEPRVNVVLLNLALDQLSR